jgi:hypothetical protein
MISVMLEPDEALAVAVALQRYLTTGRDLIAADRDMASGVREYIERQLFYCDVVLRGLDKLNIRDVADQRIREAANAYVPSMPRD